MRVCSNDLALVAGLAWCHDGCACAAYSSAEERNGCRYNEIVLDAHVWSANLPALIEAVIYPPGQREMAMAMAEIFRRQYAGREGAEVTVLMFDQNEAEAARAPFAAEGT